MKPIEMRFAKDFDKSFVVFRETGKYFPCPWHYHPEYELVLVTKSTGRRMVGDNIGYFDEGDLVFMGPKLPHVWVNDPQFINGKTDSTADAIVIHFVEDFLGESFLQIPEMENFKNFLSRSLNGMVILGKAKESITALLIEMPTKNGLQRLASLFTIFDILASTNEYKLLASPGYIQSSQYKSSDRFSKINQYIMQNFYQDIALPEIASVANMAVTTFCNFFKEHYRQTFIEYLNTVRIGHACKLLAEKDQKIVEIAYECGYNNLANFNRQFKKMKLMSPSDYRKTLDL
ncbi:MAG: helix-turn-helix protein [Flavisolibacter sp.]|jgi:AraC-like DNA-binding protein|nr:helix-turn-helix protein [Flavisolibacter sp.]